MWITTDVTLGAMRALSAFLFALVALVALPRPLAACSALVPTFDAAVQGSSLVVLGTVTKATNTDESSHPDEFTIRVERVLRGAHVNRIVIDQPAYLCGDNLGPDSVGRRVIVATDVPFYRQLLSPFWWERRPGVLDGLAEFPAGVTTLDELADRIAALPDTATEDPARGATPGSLVWTHALVGLLALAVFVARPFARRRAS